jgi:hypothetical protein
LLDAVRTILRPLVRLMIARGVTLPALVAALKQTFVEVAVRDFRLDGSEPSDSRVSVLTGVHRKDVRTLRDAARPPPGSARRPLAATVVGRWLGDPAFLDAAGRPARLRRQADGGAPSFEALVEGVSRDVHPRTVLDELLRLGLVELDAAGEAVRLLAEGFVPSGDDAAALGFFQQNLHDHAAAATANLLAGPDDPRCLERAVFYNNIPAAELDRIEGEARTLSLAALRHLNGLALEAQQAGHAAPGPKARFRFGVFFWREAPSDASPEERR